jgi:hypothetical protein
MREQRLTVVNHQIIGPRPHSLSVVALVQFAESRKTSRPHPDLESLPFLEVGRRRILSVSIGVAIVPVRRGDYVSVIVRGFAVEIFVTVPRDTRVILHMVYPRIISAGLGRVREHGAGEGIVEHGVGDQSAGIIRLAALTIQGSAVRVLNVAVRSLVALELVGIEGEDISAMVLVEVGEVVVEENRRAHLLWNGELEMTSRVRDADTVVELNGDVVLLGPLRIH